jgi:chromosome segregation ATPase
MDWLNMQWISTYWMPLLIALVLGFILGWLLTGLSPRRKNAAYEAQIADLESRSRKTERDLTDVRKQADQYKGTAAATESTLNDVRNQLTAAEASLQKVAEERAGFEADVQSRNIEVADLKMQLALLQDQFDKAKSSDAADTEALRSGLDSRLAEIAALTAARDSVVTERDQAAAERDQVTAELASVRSSSEEAMKSLTSKDAALNESYQRVVNLQRVLEDRDAALAAAQAELSAVRTDVASLNSMKAELEDRLQKVRGDVAGEMAVLTSTMVKLKEEQLATANARIAELMQELNAQKASQAVG